MNKPQPWEGLGSLRVFQYSERSNVRAVPLLFENVWYDGVTVEKGITEFETYDGQIYHVPNVAYFQVDPNLISKD